MMIWHCRVCGLRFPTAAIRVLCATFERCVERNADADRRAAHRRRRSRATPSWPPSPRPKASVYNRRPGYRAGGRDRRTLCLAASRERVHQADPRQVPAVAGQERRRRHQASGRAREAHQAAARARVRRACQDRAAGRYAARGRRTSDAPQLSLPRRADRRRLDRVTTATRSVRRCSISRARSTSSAGS